MALAAKIQGLWRELRRRWQAWRVRLRRQRAAVALLMTLTLILAEPLLCIIHCELWLPLAYHSYFAAQHQHDHHAMSGAAMAAEESAPAADTASVIAPETSSGAVCFMDAGLGSGAPVPFHVPPSPVHDVLPTLLVVLLVVLLIHMRPAAPPGDPPSTSIPPLLRPPILGTL